MALNAGGSAIAAAADLVIRDGALYFPSLALLYGSPTTTSGTTGFLLALPLITGRGGAIDRVSFGVTTGGGAGSVGRIGLYECPDLTTLYPGKLLADSGSLDTTTTGLKEATVSLTLRPDSLYWIALTFGTAAPTINTASIGYSILGYTFSSGIAVNAATWLLNPFAFGALPDPFTPGAGKSTTNWAGWVRYTGA